MKLKKMHEIYIKLMTKSSVLFLPCLMLFIILILCFILSIKVDVINTYSASVKAQNSKVYLKFDVKPLVDSKTMYVYNDKNGGVYEVNAYNSGVRLYKVNYNGKYTKDFFTKNNGKKVKVDITYGKASLFSRIFIKR